MNEEKRGGTDAADALGSGGEGGAEGNSSEELMTQESPEMAMGESTGIKNRFALALTTVVAGNVGPL